MKSGARGTADESNRSSSFLFKSNSLQKFPFLEELKSPCLDTLSDLRVSDTPVHTLYCPHTSGKTPPAHAHPTTDFTLGGVVRHGDEPPDK